MKKFVDIANNPLVKGSFVVLVAVNIQNVFSYLFQLLVLRALSPDEYRILFGSLAVLSITGVFPGVMSQVGTKVSAELKAKGDFVELTSLFTSLLKLDIFYGLVVFILGFIFRYQVIRILSIDEYLYIIFLIFVSVSSVRSPIALLNGLLKFKSYGFTIFLSGFLKLFVPIISLYLGFRLVGIYLGMGIASLLVVFVAIFLLKGSFVSVVKSYSVKKLIPIFVPLFLVSIFNVLLFNIDILLVNKYFSVENAALYSSVALIGRMVLYGGGAASMVLVPIIAEKKELGVSSKNTVVLSMFITFLLGGAIAIVLALFPNQINIILFSNKYPGVVPYLGLFSFFMLIYAILQNITAYFIGASKFVIWKFLMLTSVLQFFGILFFHSSLYSVIWVNIVAVSIALLLMFGYLYKIKYINAN